MPRTGAGHDPTMTWTLDEIATDWLAEGQITVSPQAIVEAFNRVERDLGREGNAFGLIFVMGRTILISSEVLCSIPRRIMPDESVPELLLILHTERHPRRATSMHLTLPAWACHGLLVKR